VPPDLVAIVELAMARDAAARYADAGALGDDLRRFLRGQLVAAHRYSRGQRLARWLRRNRAAIVVATAAAVALITVATLSLRRIVDDRDRIRASEHRTRSALAQAEDQNDRLLLETARAAVDVDPTYALTRLAELPATSARWPQARSIASAARARGITFAFAAADAAPWATTTALIGQEKSGASERRSEVSRFRLPTLTLLRSGSGVCGSPHSQRRVGAPPSYSVVVFSLYANADVRR